MIRPIAANNTKDPKAILLAMFPKSLNSKVIDPYRTGPKMEEIFPDKANNPKNSPLLCSGVSSIISVLDATHVPPSEIPKRLPAIQNKTVDVVHAPIVKAVIIMAATRLTACLAPIFLLQSRAKMNR